MVEKDFPNYSRTGINGSEPCVYEIEDLSFGWMCIRFCKVPNLSKGKPCSFNYNSRNCKKRLYTPSEKIIEPHRHNFKSWNRGPKKMINHIL